MKSSEDPKLLYTHVPPQGFQPTVQAAGCYLECGGQLLFLLRASGCAEEHTWCLPGGKLEGKESPRDAIIREVFEETGLSIDAPDLSFFQSFYKRLPEKDIAFHVFRKPIQVKHTPRLRPQEHAHFQWLTPQEALKIRLISGGFEILKYYINRL